MPEIHWKENLAKVHKVDPDKAWEEIQKVCAANGGLASPQAIVDHARPKRNPLHKAFEWDDSKAAEAFRRDQARNLVANFTLVFEDGRSAPAMVNVTINKQRGYKPTQEALDDMDLRRQVLKQALSQLLSLEARYRSLTELAGIFSAVHEKAREVGIEQAAA